MQRFARFVNLIKRNTPSCGPIWACKLWTLIYLIIFIVSCALYAVAWARGKVRSALSQELCTDPAHLRPPEQHNKLPTVGKVDGIQCPKCADCSRYSTVYSGYSTVYSGYSMSTKGEIFTVTCPNTHRKCHTCQTEASDNGS